MKIELEIKTEIMKRKLDKIYKTKPLTIKQKYKKSNITPMRHNRTLRW